MRVCSVEGCDKKHFGNGYCGMHYQRLARFGSLDDPNPKDKGKRKKHPLFRKWCQIKRLQNGRAKEWDDFWQFVNDVKERPNEYMLEALDYSIPIGPENFKWSKMGFGLVKPRTKPNHCIAPNCTKSVRTSGLCKTHYERFRATGKYELDLPKGIDLEKRNLIKRKQHIKSYGISFEDFEKLLNEQNGKCKICNKESERLLHIDHCHKTNTVRGLLCSNCNLALGLFEDEIDNLKSAIIYLEEHNAWK